MQPRLIEGEGNTGVGAKAPRWGVGAIGAGVNSGGSLQPKNRRSHHKYKYESPKQFELKQS